MFLYLRKLFLFAIVVCITYVVFVYLFLIINKISYKNIIDPSISNSPNLNFKMAMIRERQVEILGMGSSIANNSLDSRTIIDSFNNKHYFNASSVGFTIREDYNLIKLYNKIHKIKKLFLVGTIADFVSQDKKVDYEYLQNYLLGKNDFLSFKKVRLENLRFTIILKEALKDPNFKSNEKSHSYDYYGQEILKKEIITPEFKKITEKVLSADVNLLASQKDKLILGLKYLDSIGDYCKINNITFYFVQCPIATSYVSGKIDMINKLDSFSNSEEEVVKRHGAYFIKTYHKYWDDSLFHDFQHMNELGGRALTKYCFEQIKN